MDKTKIRKAFFLLKNKGHSSSVCRRLLKAEFNYDVTIRTLKRWSALLNKGDWDLQDQSKRPHTIHYKINPHIEQEIITLRKRTGWGSEKLAIHLPNINLCERTIDKILDKHNLLRESKNKGSRKKWVRWQRHHPNSLWQIDHTNEQEKFDCYTLSVLDDCSRFSLALVQLKHLSTDVVTHILGGLIRIHGTPRQILTDNGNVYGLKSKHSRFDIWCRRKNIQHIRTKVHSPTTNGKVERLFKTMDEELEYCGDDFELFRLRYNHFRPHSSLGNLTPADVYFAFHRLF
jgi:transposase InsO family protein